MSLLLLLPDVAPTTIPELADVGALLRARTKERGGNEVGTFTGLTRPTSAGVELLIAQAANEVLGKVQAPTVGTDYEGRVKAAIALYAAMLVELSYFPEQARSDRSAYSMLRDLYDLRIRALIAEGESGAPEGMGSGGAGGGGDAPGDASWAFPADPYGFMVGWGTKWLYDESMGARCQ